MKLKKVILMFLIILLGLGGSLFGCTKKPLNLIIKADDEIVSKISLSLDKDLPKTEDIENNLENQENNEENPEVDNGNENETPEEVDLSKKTIYLFGENANNMFEKGLIVSFSEQNIVSCELNKTESAKFKDCFAYDIVAIQPKNVVITFETNDKKTKTTLEVEVLQDCTKIEKNIHSENYVIKGKNQQLSNNVVNFTPNTTTNKKITYKLSEDYAGLELTEDGFLKFNEDFDQNLTEFYVDVFHSNYVEESENSTNFVVLNIKFDILNKIDEIVAVNKDNAKLTNLEFATNLSGEFDYKTIKFKKVTMVNGQPVYENIDDSYNLKYYLKNASNNLVSLKPEESDKFALTISQNGRDGFDAMVVKIENSIWPSYSSNEIEISINVKTYPNSISINGLVGDSEFIIYDNNQSKELEIKVSDSFNTDFKILPYQQDLITLKYQNDEIILTETIKNGTKIYISCAEYVNFGIENEIITSFIIQSVGNETLKKEVKVRIIKNLNDANIIDENGERIANEIEIYKVGLDGKNTISKFSITSSDNIKVPEFEVEIENSNIVCLENLVNNGLEKSFSLKALTTGETLVTVKFDNGLVKFFTVKVYTAIKDVNLNFSNSSSIGKIEEETTTINGQSKTISKYYLKNGTISQIIFDAIDINDKPVYDKFIINSNFVVTNNDGNIVLSNDDNKLYALKVTNGGSVNIKAKIDAYVYDETENSYKEKIIVKEFNIEIYEPIKNVKLSKDYIELYTKDSLGMEDYEKSSAEIELTILPENATEFEYSSVQFECYSDSAVIGFDENTAEETSNGSGIYKLKSNKLKIIAQGFTNTKTTDTATISFTIQDYVGALFTKRVTIRVSKAEQPEKILVENVTKLSTENGEVDYLYFNLGLNDEQNQVNINPQIYPINSLNTDYIFEIKNSQNNDDVDDVISFDKKTGIVSPLKAGECKLILIPKGCITLNEHNDVVYSKQREIYIKVADGEKIPYSISTKQDLFNLCKEITIEASNGTKETEFITRFSKNYVLTSDIDLSGEEIVPIGTYKYKTKSGEEVRKVGFSGTFSGLFEILGLKQSYSITGIKLNIDSTYSSSIINNQLYLGLFAENYGTISNLKLQYSSISAFVSRFTDPINFSGNANQNGKFNFGGISAINCGTIENCEVKINSCEIETYFGKNFVGAISGSNQSLDTKNGLIKNCYVEGNINIVDGFKLHNKEDAIYYPIILVGGVAGINNGNCQIVGEFDIYSNQNEIFNKNLFNSILNLSSVFDGKLVEFSNESAFGGVVGQNEGIIQNMSSYGKIFAYQNVGGIAGINTGKIGGYEDSKRFGCFSSSIIYGNTVVGGLIGKNNSGEINFNSVIFLDDGESFENDGIRAKIYANSFVAGLIGQNESGTLNNNFVRSFVQKTVTNNYFDIFASLGQFEGDIANFGALISKDINKTNIASNEIAIEDDTNKNFADNLKIGYKIDEQNTFVVAKGNVADIGIVAPNEITVDIKDSTLNESTLYSYNKFIKGDDNTIILYYYKDINDIKYNYYLRNYLFEIGCIPTDANDLKKIESSSPEVLSVDSKGNFSVNKAGETKLKIYSVLNKSAVKEVTVKIIDIIDSLSLFEDNLHQKKIDTIYVEKDASKNIYLSHNVLQKDIFVKFESTDDGIVSINSNEEFYSALNAQVVFGKNLGTARVTASLYVLVNGNYYSLPSSFTFNVCVSAGLKEFNVSVEKVELATNAFVNFNALVNTDLTDKTYFAVDQILNTYDENGNEVLREGEYLKYEFDKEISSEQIKLTFKVYPNKEYLKDIIGKTIKFKIYACDSFVEFKQIKDDENKFAKHIKTIEFIVKESDVLNAEFSFFADGEVVKNEQGQEVINTNELESEFIKIGKIGILKILVYPKENINSSNKITLTYSNSDNLNLSFKQVKKFGDGYVDVITSSLIPNGIVLDNSYLLDDENEQYLYVKLLTDSPIKEDSKFELNLHIDGFDYDFEKTLTSSLASNLEISFEGAVLNAQGNLEGVYAKGVTSQHISLTVNKLTDFVPKFAVDLTNLSGSNFVEISQLKDPESVGKNSLRYDYVINGLNNSSLNENIEIYFYIDKVVNNKTERYKSNTLKLNIVDFVVKNMFVEGVENGYLTKPMGTSYPLKVKLDTINNGTSEVLNQILALEEQISKHCETGSLIKSDIWKYAGENLEAGFKTKNFEILKEDYFEIKPIEVIKTSGFGASFAIAYENSEIKLSKSYSSKNDIFFDAGNYCKQFNVNFGAEFYIQTDINNPVPVYNAKEFISMKQNGNYILMNDIVLQKDSEIENLKNGYSPMMANFNSLDGNGCKVIIKNLNIDLTNVQNEYEFGLFTEVSENTLIKNLTIKYDLEANEDSSVVASKNMLNFENIVNLSFGAVCAVNKGLIYNCQVEGIKTNRVDQIMYINVSNIVGEEQTLAWFGGFVCKNEGIITNSRSELMLCVSKGFVGGFVSENTGTISSCYYKNMIVKNLGEDENTSSSAGFVYNNEGIIKFSFVEGNSNFVNNGVFSCDSSLALYTLSAPTSVAGFVFNNAGEIQDCYANLSISSQSYSGGFVFVNNGLIKRSYSASINEKENNTAHAPFIATKISFNEEEMKTKIIDCFYLNINKSSINDKFVTGLNLRQFNDEYYLTNFVFDKNDCIWKFVNENYLPTLVEANNIALSKRSLYKVTETLDGGVKYSYIYNDGLYAGSEENPIIISNEEEFIEYFSINGKTNSQYYRIINNINFNDYVSVPTYNYTFSGSLDGNGLEISNIRISAPSDYSGEAFGLFAKIEKYSGLITPMVKNLVIKPIEVYANNSYYVGSLAGIVKDADVINVNVDGSDVIVQGRNIVGGVVGFVYGESNLVNITSNVSVNSNFASSVNNSSAGFNLFCSYKNSNDNVLTNAEDVSYAGSICGVVDTEKTITNNERIRNIQVLGGTKSIASFSGLAFGLICENGGIDNVKVYVNNSSYINSNYAGSLVCGENRGYVSRVETIFEGLNQTNTSSFKNNCKFIGGIVGFNNNGTVVNSISAVDVIGNDNTIVAGGVIGLSVGGACSSVIASNNVWSNKIVGGIIGFAGRRDMLSETDVIEYKIDNIEVYIDTNIKIETVKTNNIMYISNCIAINNFGDKTLAYINSSDNSHFVGAIIGAAHNTLVKTGETISVATKNSYISFGNYFEIKDLDVSEYDEHGNLVGERKFDYLQDFGINNVDSFDFSSNNKNTKSENPCGEGLESENLIANVIFKNWSSNIFALENLTTFNKNNLPKLKSVNNINTKKLEGEGTYSDPYRIDSVRAINELSNIVKEGKTKMFVEVTDNIEATGKEFNNIGDGINKFGGTFNGNGCFINGLTYFNVDNYNTQNYFGLFGYLSTEAKVQNLNVVANFVINYVQPLTGSSSITATGIISGFNEGYISNCNVYGGMICTLKNNTSKISLSYVGGICGINGGQISDSCGLYNCKNYATIYVTINDVENDSQTEIDNVSIYAGFITGANLNEAIINKCENKAIKSIDLNKGAKTPEEEEIKNFTLIVINNAEKENCKNYVNSLAGFVSNADNLFGDNYEFSENIYNYCYHTA